MPGPLDPLAKYLQSALAKQLRGQLLKHTGQEARDFARGSLEAKGVSNITDFDINHEIARHNAALPGKKGGLDLTQENTAEDRAKALRFGDELYHGSLRGDIKAFNPTVHGSDESFAGRGVYATSEPGDASVNYASAHGPDVKQKIGTALEHRSYSEEPHGVNRAYNAFNQGDLSPERTEKLVRGTGVGDNLGVVYPVRMRGQVVDMDAPRGKGPQSDPLLNYDEAAEDYSLTDAGQKVQDALHNQLGHAAKAGDVDSMFYNIAMEDEPTTLNDLRRSIVKRVNDAEVYNDEGLPVPGAGVSADVMRDLGVGVLQHRPNFGNPMLNMAESHNIALMPEYVRSRFAAFDPARKKSSDILGFSTPEFMGLVGAGSAATPYIVDALRKRE
jgi:hypothetical protein